MAKMINRLDPLTIKGLKAPNYYLDGNGLYLQISKSGSKSWIFKYTLNGRSREMGLGPEHTVSLVKAREIAAAQRMLLLEGKDPIDVREAIVRAQQLEQAKRVTFAECAERYINVHKSAWKNAKHCDQWTNTIATYVNPLIGQLPVQLIDTALVMKCLGAIWVEKPETASRLRGRIESILDYAKVNHFRSGDNPARWKGHLDYLLPTQSRSKRIKHFPALPHAQIAAFMQDLRYVDGISARALEFVILTCCRSGEVRCADWTEIDMATGVWCIPGERMKAGKEHDVPLSKPALTLLDEMKREYGGRGFIFPGAKHGKPLSDMSLTALIRRMDEFSMKNGGNGWRDKNGEVITAHGFRSTFRDWVGDVTNHPKEVAEHALAHQLPDEAEAAYHRSTLLMKRRRLMNDWAAFIDDEFELGEVLPFPSTAVA